MGIQISVNGVSEELSTTPTIHQYLKGKSINPEHVVVEVNKSVVKREKFENFFFQDNDTVEVMRFVGGG